MASSSPPPTRLAASALVLFGPFACSVWAPGLHDQDPRNGRGLIREIESRWGTQEVADKVCDPHAGSTRRAHRRFALPAQHGDPRVAAQYALRLRDRRARRLPLIAVPTLLVLHREAEEPLVRATSRSAPGALIEASRSSSGAWPGESWGVRSEAAAKFLDEPATSASTWSRTGAVTVLFTDIVDSPRRRSSSATPAGAARRGAPSTGAA